MVENEKQPGGAIVRIKGLPPKATCEDVLEFFDGFKVQAKNVHLVTKGKRSAGEALIVFPTLDEAQQACIKDRDIFAPKYGDRYVRVLLAEDVSPADLLNPDGRSGLCKLGARGGRQASAEAETVAKVCGLPPGVTLQELLQLFWGLQARPANTHIVPQNEGPVEAYVDFATSEHASQAVSSRNGITFTTASGTFKLAVKRVGKAEWEAVLAARQQSDGILRVKGLPTKATARDVLAFFQGFDVRKGGVHIQPHSENRHSKVAFVEFCTPQEATRALSRDRQQFGEAFGDRYCLLQLVSRQEMEHVRQQNFRPPGNSSFSNGMGPSGSVLSTGDLSSGGLSNSVMSGMGGSGGVGPAIAPPPVVPPGLGYFGVPSAAALMPPQMQLPGGGFPGNLMGSISGIPYTGMGHGSPAGMAGLMAGHAPGLVQLAAAGAAGLSHPAAAAAAVAAAAQPQGGAGGMPGSSWGGPAAARYMVQDLSTGQRVFLDPRFNVSFNPSEEVNPWLRAQTQSHSHSMSLSDTSNGMAGHPAMGPAASERGVQASYFAHPAQASGFSTLGALDGQVGRAAPWFAAAAPSNGGGSGGSSNTQNGSGGNGNGSDPNGSGSDANRNGSGSGSGSGSDNDREGSDGDGGAGGSSGKSGTDAPPLAGPAPPPHLHPQLQQQAAHQAQQHLPLQHQHVASAHGARPAHVPSGVAAARVYYQQPSVHPHRAHAHLHPPLPPHSHQTLKHVASRGSAALTTSQMDATLPPLQKRCRSE